MLRCGGKPPRPALPGPRISQGDDTAAYRTFLGHRFFVAAKRTEAMHFPFGVVQVSRPIPSCGMPPAVGYVLGSLCILLAAAGLAAVHVVLRHHFAVLPLSLCQGHTSGDGGLSGVYDGAPPPPPQ